LILRGREDHSKVLNSETFAAIADVAIHRFGVQQNGALTPL